MTSDRPAQNQVAHPSWTLPIVVGAVATFVLHSPLLARDSMWLYQIGMCGCTGVPTGLLAAGLALRRDPRMGAASGFAVGFIANGIGAIALAVIAIGRGYHLETEDLDTLREGLRKMEQSESQIRTFLDALQHTGAGVTVFGAMLLALSGGLISALAAGLYGRHLARRSGPPAARP